VFINLVAENSAEWKEMKKMFAALLIVLFMVISIDAGAEEKETLGSGTGASAAVAQDKAEAMLEKRVVSACDTKAKGGVAPGIAKSKCKVEQSSTGKYSAVCTQKFSCNNS
jgi:hypothetical protein